MFPERLRLDGDYPVFAQTLDNRTYLFWISQVNRAVLRGEFVGGELQDVRAISQLPDLSGSDRLIEFSAMFDRTHQYLFWNIMAWRCRNSYIAVCVWCIVADGKRAGIGVSGDNLIKQIQTGQ